MNRNREYELQCLLELISAAMNNEARPEWPRSPDWGALYKMADYHHVANVLYGMIIGMDDKKIIRWKGSFEERFRYCVVMHEKYRNAEKIVLKVLEKNKIHCLELEETIICGCYGKKEQHYPMAIGFLIETGKREELTEAMQKIGLKPKQVSDVEEDPEELHFQGPSGLLVIFYERLSFTNKKTHKYFSLPPQPFRKKKGCKFTHVQDIDDFYIYYVATLAEKFARGSLEIRDVMDLWQYYQLCYEKMEWKTINKELKRMELDIFSDLIVKLAATWFGNFEGFDEDSPILMSMERYIISKGIEAREDNEAVLPLVKEVADIYARDRRKERRRRTLELWFPERSYMEAIYPVLSDKGWLLPFCWIGRLTNRQWRKVKYFFGRIGKKIGSITGKIRGKFAWLPARFKKEKKEIEDWNDWGGAEQEEDKEDENKA